MKLSINWRLLILLVGALALVNPMAQASDHKSDDGSSDARSAASDDKEELIRLLKEPPITEDELPPNVPPPPSEFVGGLQDRYQVVGINPYALERAGHAALAFTVVTTSGEYPDEADIHVALDWRVNPGLRNVPINVPVLLSGKDDTSYNWSFMQTPAGSSAALTDPLTQYPEFTPDVVGLYKVMDGVSGEMLEVYAGTWRGVIKTEATLAATLLDPPAVPPVVDTDFADGGCGTCHGEPLRHARFQQWQLSRHSAYDVAIDEGDSGNCSRCHTGNGFLTWLPILNGDAPGDPLDNITVAWTADEVHPQTCVTCHDPHNAGSISGDETDAPMRVQGDTPPLIAGFQAFNVGKGAMYMTCHNTRRGLRNDDQPWPPPTGDPDRAPHGGVQADTLMGQNAYFVTVGIVGSHTPDGNGRPADDPRALPDTCVDCHMRKTDPPEDLAYNLNGANHTFFASDQVCLECHGPDQLEFVRNQIGGLLDELAGLITGYYTGVINDALTGGCTIDLDGDGVISVPAELLAMRIATSRGRQAMIFELVSGEVGPKRLTTVDIIGGCAAGGTSLFDQSTEIVTKATWNHLLVVTDQSGGVHNRRFASDALKRAIDAMASP